MAQTNHLNIPEGSIFQIKIQIQYNPEIRNSDIIGKKMFLVSSKHSDAKLFNTERIITIDLLPYVFKDGTRIFKIKRLILYIDRDYRISRQCDIEISSINRLRKGNGKRIGDHSTQISATLEILKEKAYWI